MRATIKQQERPSEFQTFLADMERKAAESIEKSRKQSEAGKAAWRRKKGQAA